MTGERTPVIIRITEPTVKEGSIDRPLKLLETFARERLNEYRNRIQFRVEGYDTDTRELYEIAEVRRFFQRLKEAYRGLFYWIDVRGDMLLFIGLMIYEPQKEGEAVGLSPGDMEEYLSEGLSGLEVFCEAQGVSSGDTVREVERYVKRKVGN